MLSKANQLPFYIGLRYLMQRKSSRSVSFMSMIAIIGLVVAVMLLVVVLSIMNGFKYELEEKILAIMPEVSIYNSEPIQDWRSLAERMEHSSINSFAPFIDLNGMASRGKRVQPLIIRAIDIEQEKKVSIIDQFLKQNTLEALSVRDDAIVLGRGLAAELNLSVGDTFTLLLPSKRNPRQAPKVTRLVLIDTINTQTELDQNFGLITLSSAQKILGREGVSGIKFKLHDLRQANELATYLYANLPIGFSIDTWQRTHGHLYDAIAMSKRMVGLLLILIIAIAAFNVISTLIMVVVDKQSAIAILRTLGASQSTIMSIFVVQGALIGVVGTLIGVVLGLLLAVTVTDIVDFIESLFSVQLLDAGIYPVSFIPSKILWSDVIVIALSSLSMSFIATIFPAWKASRVKPADVLRYEV